jgi:hypothetical protein
MIRVNKIYGPDRPIPVGRRWFYENVVLRDPSDPYIPGLPGVPRLRLANLGEGVRVGFEDEIEAIGEAVRAARDALAEQAQAAAVPEAKKKRRAEAQAGGAA